MNPTEYHRSYRKASTEDLEATRNEQYRTLCQANIDFVNCALRKKMAQQRFHDGYMDKVLQMYGSNRRDEVLYSLFLARQIVERTKKKDQRFSQFEETLSLLKSGYNPQKLYLEREIDFQKRLRGRNPEAGRHFVMASNYQEDGRERNLSPELQEVARADHPEVDLSELEELALSLPHHVERRRSNRRNGNGNGDRRSH